jgi:hypothetical protein
MPNTTGGIRPNSGGANGHGLYRLLDVRLDLAGWMPRGASRTR